MDGNKNIARELRRQASTPEYRRHLQQLPQFQVEQKLPDEFRSLLSRLDANEGGRSRR